MKSWNNLSRIARLRLARRAPDDPRIPPGWRPDARTINPGTFTLQELKEVAFSLGVSEPELKQLLIDHYKLRAVIRDE